jgi:hypothetical protein
MTTTRRSFILTTEPMTDYEFTTTLETCPECGEPLDAKGNCPTPGCPGPEIDEE